jgi:putative transposase
MFKTYHLKLKNSDSNYFSRLFAEAKWYTNTIISSEDIFKFDTKSRIAFLTPEISQELNYLSSQMRQELKDRLISDIMGLSARKKKGYKVGNLRYRKVVNSIPLKNQTLKLSGNRVKFQGYKRYFRVSGLIQLPKDYKIQNAKLIRNAKGIYLDITVKVEAETLVVEKQIIGLDLGIKDAINFSDGTVVNTDFTETENRIKKAHKELSRKTKGSNRYKRAKDKLNVAYQTLANQKQDVEKKIINKLKEYKVCFQDEMIPAWKKLFGRRVQNGILGRVKADLKRNPDNLMLPRTNATTQLCPDCGTLNKLTLRERIYKCECGYSQARDIHAARNMVLIGTGQTFVETVLDLASIFSDIDSKHLSVKREAAGFQPQQQLTE